LGRNLGRNQFTAVLGDLDLQPFDLELHFPQLEGLDFCQYPAPGSGRPPMARSSLRRTRPTALPGSPRAPRAGLS
jgi:hypothetical protein